MYPILLSGVILFTTYLGAQDNLAPSLYFDSESSSFDKSLTFQSFKGDVVAFFSDSIIWADTINFDRVKGVIVASGHVIMANSQNIIGCDKFIYNLKDYGFESTNSFVISNSPKENMSVFISKTLGITPEEIEFEVARKKQIEKIDQNVIKIKSDYLGIYKHSGIDYSVDKLALILEQKEMIRQQDNPVISSYSKKRRDRIKKRRKYWNLGFSQKFGLSKSYDQGYLRLKGESIRRIGKVSYYADNSSLTPCLCDDEEKPDWGISAKNISMNYGGYASIKNAFVKVKGIPILYFPYLKLPVKKKRQSGFLGPKFSSSEINGNIYSQELFLNISDNKDTTLTASIIQNRGVQLGGEIRAKFSSGSSFFIKSNFLRDKLWLDQNNKRDELIEAYSVGLERAKAQQLGRTLPSLYPSEFSYEILSDPKYWVDLGLGKCLTSDKASNECKEDFKSKMMSSKNQWRHVLEWRGKTHLMPQLSFVTTGKLLSDHRYLSDLSFEDQVDQNNQLSNSLNYKPQSYSPLLFSKLQAKLNIDTSSFYLGVGSSIADNLILTRKFQGLQLPLSTKLISRFAIIFEKSFPFYLQFNLELKKIAELSNQDENLTVVDVDNGPQKVALGPATWGQAQVNWLAPLSFNKPYNFHYSGEFIFRNIYPSYSSIPRDSPFMSYLIKNQEDIKTTISTYRSGVTLGLPIDAIFNLEKNSPTYLGSTKTYLNHRINFECSLSFRPEVLRDGSYGKINNIYSWDNTAKELSAAKGSSVLTYFETDSPISNYSEIIPYEEKLVPHKRMTFSISNDFFLFKRGWLISDDLSSKKIRERDFKTKEGYYKELAKSELIDDTLNSNFKSAIINEKDAKKMGLAPFSEKMNKFLHIYTDLSFDWKKLEEREKRKNENLSEINLPEPWSPLRVYSDLTLKNWRFKNISRYNFYKDIFTEIDFTVKLPSFFETFASLGYKIQNEKYLNVDSDVEIKRITSQTVGLSTRLLAKANIWGEYSKRLTDSLVTLKESSAKIGVSYLASSFCWKLDFLWSKNFSDMDWKGTYFLKLDVLFGNESAGFGNLLSKFNN